MVSIDGSHEEARSNFQIAGPSDRVHMLANALRAQRAGEKLGPQFTAFLALATPDEVKAAEASMNTNAKVTSVLRGGLDMN